jgi:hypothetical protein
MSCRRSSSTKSWRISPITTPRPSAVSAAAKKPADFGSEAAVICHITVDRIDLNAGHFGGPEIHELSVPIVEENNRLVNPVLSRDERHRAWNRTVALFSPGSTSTEIGASKSVAVS